MSVDLPPDYDPRSAEGEAYTSDDEGDDGEQDSNGKGNRKSTEGRPKRPGRDEAHEITDLPHEKSSMLKALFEFFIPPLDDDPEKHRRWRIAIGFAVFVLSVSTLFSYGIFTWLGFQGFARADDMKSIKVELLEERIFGVRLLHCNATTVESRQFYAAKVQELLRKFRETEGQYRLPSCDEVR